MNAGSDGEVNEEDDSDTFMEKGSDEPIFMLVGLFKRQTKSVFYV